MPGALHTRTPPPFCAQGMGFCLEQSRVSGAGRGCAPGGANAVFSAVACGTVQTSLLLSKQQLPPSTPALLRPWSLFLLPPLYREEARVNGGGGMGGSAPLLQINREREKSPFQARYLCNPFSLHCCVVGGRLSVFVAEMRCEVGSSVCPPSFSTGRQIWSSYCWVHLTGLGRSGLKLQLDFLLGAVGFCHSHFLSKSNGESSLQLWGLPWNC